MYQRFLMLRPTGSTPIMVIIYFFLLFIFQRQVTWSLISISCIMGVACKDNHLVTCLVIKKVRIYFSSESTGQATGRLPCHLRSLVLVYVWLLVDPPALPLIHYGKREVLAVISSMEGEYNVILDWRSSTGSVPPGATMQWGSSIIIAGEVKRIHGLKRKSFMANMYGFANDGELQAIKAYLLSHGNFEIEQVSLQRGGGILLVHLSNQPSQLQHFQLFSGRLLATSSGCLSIYDHLCRSLFFRLRAMGIVSLPL